MSRSTSILLVGLLTVLMSVPASAGLGVGARYSFVRNSDTRDNSSMTGVFTRIRGDLLGLEGAIDYRDDNLGNDVVQRTWPVSASLMVYPLSGLYALAGLGWYHTSIDFPANSGYSDRTSSKLGYHLGAGLEMGLVPRVKLTGDLRYLFLDYKFKDIPSSIGKTNANAYSLNAGVIIYLK